MQLPMCAASRLAIRLSLKERENLLLAKAPSARVSPPSCRLERITAIQQCLRRRFPSMETAERLAAHGLTNLASQERRYYFHISPVRAAVANPLCTVSP